MQKSQLILVLRSFSKKEIRDFRKWLLSPIHNQREDVLKLYDYLTDNECFLQEEKLDKVLIYKYLAPKEKFDDAKMRQVMYFFSEQLDNFLVYEKFLENNFQQKAFLAATYKKRGLHKAFKKTVQGFVGDKEKNKIQSDLLFLADYEIQKEFFDYTNQHERTENTNFDVMQAALDAFYLVNKLRLACVALYHSRVFKVTYTVRFLDEIIDFVATQKIDEPLILSYYNVLLTFLHPDEEKHFTDLREKIDLHVGNFMWHDGHEIYLAAINYCVGKLNQGKVAYQRALFELYSKGIAQGFLLENNIISPYTFKNTVTIGIRIGELDWVERFIHDYKDKLEPEHRKGMVDFNLATLYHAKKEYTKAQRLLATLDVDDLLITLNAKFLLIKIYVEEKEYDLLDTHISSMRAFLNRKDLLGYHKTLYQNVLHFTKKINRIEPYTKLEKEKLIAEVKVATPLADKEWFIRQIEDL